MNDERFEQLEARVAAQHETVVAMLAAMLEDKTLSAAFGRAIGGLLTVREQDEDPGLSPDGAFAHEARVAAALKDIIRSAEARCRTQE
ncbi:hypothetical protein [Martelella sp. HB161492]|uniref:hypothetical protein n=1 Tax=Martelella sp. HB161492 TaxID=2720726 RepID=UPI001590E601|nr:hypothetical protein [Martelella sp. HB161492]